VVVMIDTLRADHVYGDGASTPNMNFLMREGLRFTRAYPEAMPTIPARNSLLSGRRMFPFRNWHDYPGLMESPGWEPTPGLQQSFTTRLRRAGYWTGYVTDNPFLGSASPFQRFRGSFDLFIRHGGQLGEVNPPSSVSERELRHWTHPTNDGPRARERVRRYLANSRYTHDETRSFAAKVFKSGVEALESAARRPPFALVLDAYEPHEPWTPPHRYIEANDHSGYRGREPGMLNYGRVSNWLNEDNAPLVLSRLHALYAAEVTMTDRWLGVFLDRLHELGLERETVIVLVSDHGIFLGEHGWTGKISVALHPALTRVPFVIVDPDRRAAGEASDSFVSLHDVGPTLLGMAGVRVPEAMNGLNLSGFLGSGKPTVRPLAYGGYGDSHYVRTDHWAYMADNRMRNARLFDVREDPGEHTDVADRHPGVVRRLRETLLERAGGRPPFYGV
jgi:arylsulfatase A-like enzyme